MPPDPILERIHGMLLTQPNEVWRGPPTQLVQVLKLEISPMSLTKRLNVNADRLLKDYQIRYNWSRGHEGRTITFQRVTAKA